jgi:hypothetical protein
MDTSNMTSVRESSTAAAQGPYMFNLASQQPAQESLNDRRFGKAAAEEEEMEEEDLPVRDTVPLTLV